MMHDEDRTWAATVEDGKPVVLARTAYRQWFAKTFGEGEDLELIIRRPVVVRSLPQNALLHVALTRWVEDTLPEYQTPSIRDGVERLKDELLGLCFGYHVYQSRLTGEIVRALAKPHTSKLTKDEFALLVDLMVEEAAKTGHVMVMPGEVPDAA